MVIALFGDSCTGKSTIAEELAQQLSAQVYSGKDYLKLARSESIAQTLFKKKLAGEETMIYVVSEKSQLSFLPKKCVRVLVVASLVTIKKRFAQRMRGNLPSPVAAMLERTFGQFEASPHDLCIDTDEKTSEDAVKLILPLLKKDRSQ